MVLNQLTQEVRTFLDSTGEDALLVLLHDDEDQVTGVHRIGWMPAQGLIVDGAPATLAFCESLHGFRPLQHPPAVLH